MTKMTLPKRYPGGTGNNFGLTNKTNYFYTPFLGHEVRSNASFLILNSVVRPDEYPPTYSYTNSSGSEQSPKFKSENLDETQATLDQHYKLMKITSSAAGESAPRNEMTEQSCEVKVNYFFIAFAILHQ